MSMNDYSFLPFGAGGIPANENSGTSLVAPRWYSGTAIPTSGLNYGVGDVVWNTNPSSGSPAGWICYTAGAGGTALFQAFAIASPVPSVVTATSGTLTSGTTQFLLNPATASTYSLPEVSTARAGTVLAIKNISANQVTLTPLGTDNYFDATAITLSGGQGVELVGNGPTTTWYNRIIAQLPTQTTTATSGTLTNGLRLILLNPATTGTYSLPEASANYAGFQCTIKNLASGATTLTPLASDQYDKGVAAITLAQFAVVNLITDSTTNWFKAS